MRRATQAQDGSNRTVIISIHALHEESDLHAVEGSVRFHISIHALHEESDGMDVENVDSSSISIHALHEESDLHSRGQCRREPVISIHALHEESD